MYEVKILKNKYFTDEKGQRRCFHNMLVDRYVTEDFSVDYEKIIMENYTVEKLNRAALNINNDINLELSVHIRDLDTGRKYSSGDFWESDLTITYYLRDKKFREKCYYSEIMYWIRANEY